MKRFLLLLSCAIALVVSAADTATLAELDSVIDSRSTYIATKQRTLDQLSHRLHAEKNEDRTLQLLDQLYNESNVFRFDSAVRYAHRGLELARQRGDVYHTGLFSVHTAQILAIGGLYSEAITCLDEAKPTIAVSNLDFEYNIAYFTVYTYWAEYCHDETYAPRYRARAAEYLQRAMEFADDSDPSVEYYRGEYSVYVSGDQQAAREHYHKALKTLPEDTRLYAMSSHALAGNYRMAGDSLRYEQYLISAAIADLKSNTMENMALQNLAMFLFSSDNSDLERALRYINVSMDDAKFYNNRLRIIEISNVLPGITAAYQSQVQQQNSRLRYYLAFISVLLISVMLLTYLIHRQSLKIARRREELAESNRQLSLLNGELADGTRQQAALNEQLNQLNSRLVDTNKKRENLATIYIDLCSRFIEKLTDYQTLVKRKIKANQAAELLTMITSARLSDEDANTFLNRFDKAFLDMYPSFVDEFNSLLRPECRITPKTHHSLTTELRTFALIRLGVKNTAAIANLLFLSNQTIYNCRSTVKNHAIDKDTFDDDVMRLCMVIE